MTDLSMRRQGLNGIAAGVRHSEVRLEARINGQVICTNKFPATEDYEKCVRAFATSIAARKWVESYDDSMCFPQADVAIWDFYRVVAIVRPNGLIVRLTATGASYH